MSTHRYDREFETAAKAFLQQKAPVFTTPTEIRALNEQFLPEIMKGYPVVQGIEQTPFNVKSYDGESVQLTRFASPAALASATPAPAVLFIHGGAMVAGSVKVYGPQIAYLAHRTGFPIFGIDWRLAPEHPAPVGMEDCYAALSWISRNGQELNVDASKLVVMGDSAGGLLSASTALMARDRQLSPPLAKQVLIYPTLDDRIDFTENDPRRDLLLWRPSDSAAIWKAYLDNDKAGTEEAVVAENTVPQRIRSLGGLPSTYIDVGTLDFFMDEILTYTQRLVSAGVEVELHTLPGLPHGWELAGGIGWFERAMDLRVAAIKRV
ncbi:uncharacterized protein HMPREF1541_06005 [Cyphellophora europaea CBS 101466]|uniref:Alpha/beta hydrolase fold-3 domain-containing protein n=1 Tax=Cyphellophora europaea (strain CBS 101466) TaxID=1220924 RepID=W2RVP7_CYPE1|nr:uncharacterized protein HMPREF1541_06005 [Cyphellophora europaea CBS 101466]ETN39779.1 hypothetical protein HMPREF1541_06005 [Cyphellophora europaea CBS 101466]